MGSMLIKDEIERLSSNLECRIEKLESLITEHNAEIDKFSDELKERKTELADIKADAEKLGIKVC